MMATQIHNYINEPAYRQPAIAAKTSHNKITAIFNQHVTNNNAGAVIQLTK